MQGRKSKREGSSPYPWFVNDYCTVNIFLMGVTHIYYNIPGTTHFYNGAMYPLILVLIACGTALLDKRRVQDAIDNSPGHYGTARKVVV